MAVSAINNAFSGAKAPTTAGSGWWEPIIEVGASVLGAVMDNNGVNAATKAATGANNEAIALNRDVFNTNLQLSKPFYQGSGNAFNLLSNISGMPAQDFSFPSAISGGGYGSNGASAANNWGAGQPVQGHSGGGGANAFTGAAGAAIGNVFGGPIGGAIGGALGGMFRNGGDNWQTIATGAPSGYDYDAYFATDPGLAQEWNKPDVQSLFNGNRDAYLYWHSQGGGGKWAPRELSKTAASGDASQVAGSTSPIMGDPLKMFWDSPDGKLATNQFLTIDNPAIKGAFATAGKSISGAQQIALSDRGAALSGNAFNNYRGGVERLAGFGTTASGQAQNAGNSFANNVTPTMQTNGVIAGGAAQAKNNNWTNAFKNAATGVYDYAKGAGWV